VRRQPWKLKRRNGSHDSNRIGPFETKACLSIDSNVTALAGIRGKAQGKRKSSRTQIISCHPAGDRTFCGTRTLTITYEKICFILNHSLNRHRVCRFLHATTGNNGNFDDGGDHQGVTIAITA